MIKKVRERVHNGGTTGTESDYDVIHYETSEDMLVGQQQLFNSNGYRVLPGGLIMQWGRVAVATGNSVNITFPISFTSSPFTIQVTGDYGNTDRYTSLVGGVSKTSFSIYKRTFSSGTSTDFCYWFAIGM